MAEFVFFCQTHPRLWLLVRRIYGVAPLIPSSDAHPDDLRVWTRAEMDGEGYSVKADLEALRGFWVNHCKREAPMAASRVPPRWWRRVRMISRPLTCSMTWIFRSGCSRSRSLIRWRA